MRGPFLFPGGSNLKKLALFILALLLVSVALAQDAIPGVPAEYQSLVTLLIGWLTGWATLGLTAIWKKVFQTSGPSTVLVSAVMSLLAGFSFTAYAALSIRGDAPWWQALVSAGIGFIGANGTYISRVLASASALKKVAADGAKDSA